MTGPSPDQLTVAKNSVNVMPLALIPFSSVRMKSVGLNGPWRFESGHRHTLKSKTDRGRFWA